MKRAKPKYYNGATVQHDSDEVPTVKIAQLCVNMFQYEWIYFVLNVKGWLLLQIPALAKAKMYLGVIGSRALLVRPLYKPHQASHYLHSHFLHKRWDYQVLLAKNGTNKYNTVHYSLLKSSPEYWLASKGSLEPMYIRVVSPSCQNLCRS